MMKLKLLILFMFPVFAFAQTSITLQPRSVSGQRYFQYTFSGIPGGGYDTLWNAKTIRSYGFSLFPVGSQGQQLKISKENANYISVEDPLVYGNFIYTDDQLSRALANGGASQEQVFNVFERFSHGTTPVSPTVLVPSNNIPGTPLHTNSWAYDSGTNTITSTFNTGDAIGFFSPDKFSNYIHTLTLSSTAFDNDRIGTVIAFMEDPNEMVTNYAYGLDPGDFNWPINVTDPTIPNQHSLTLYRNRNGIDPSYFVVYDYGKLTQQIIANGDSQSGLYKPTSNWSNGTVDIKVQRIGDSVKVYTTNFSDAPGGKGALRFLMQFSLNDNPVLAKFKGPQSYGYAAQSQSDAAFTNISFSASPTNIYDLRNGDTYIYTSSGYAVDSTRNVYQDLKVRYLWRNQAEKTFGYVKPDSTYDVIADSALNTYTASNGITKVGSDFSLGGVINGVLFSGEDAYFTTSLHTSDSKYSSFLGVNSTKSLMISNSLLPLFPGVETVQAAIQSDEGTRIDFRLNVTDSVAGVPTNKIVGLQINSGIASDTYAADTTFTGRFTDTWRHKGIVYSGVNRNYFVDTSLVDKGYVDGAVAQVAKLARKYPESNMPDTVIASVFGTVSVNPVAISKDDIRLTTRYGRMAQVPGSFPNTGYNRPTYVSGTAENPFAAFEFIYDGDVLEFYYYETGTSKVRYFVDGQAVNSGTAYDITNGGSVGGLLYQTLTFNNAKRRVIRVEGIGDFRWGNVKIQTGHNVFKSSSFFTNVVLFGDSFDEGTGANWWTGFPVVIGKKNNWNVWASGSGGTGYVATGTVGTRFNFKDRLITDVFPYDPEYLWISGGINDVSRISNGSWTHAQYLARVDSTIKSVRDSLPNLKELVVTSSWWPADTTIASKVVVDSCIQVTAAKYHAIYINTRGIFTGSGHVGAPTGIGNADSLISSDGTHPTLIGHQYLGEQLLIRYYIIKAQQAANWAIGGNSSPPVHDQPINTLNDIIANKVTETGNFEQLATDAALTLDTYHKQITLPVITANRAITLPTGFNNYKFTLINQNTSGFAWSLPAATVYYPDGTTTLTTLTNGQIYNIEYSVTQAKYIVASTSVFSGIVPPSQGGTGIANSSTITLGGAVNTASTFTTTGAFALTLNATASTVATVPSGTVTLFSTKSSSMNSAQLSGSLTDESGTGAAIFAGSPALTGTPTAPTASAATSTTQIATTAFVTTADNLKANLASPTFTGVPAAPTPASNVNTTQIPTTAWVNIYYGALAASNIWTAANTFQVNTIFSGGIEAQTFGLHFRNGASPSFATTLIGTGNLADRNQTLQDDDGVVALTKNIPTLTHIIFTPTTGGTVNLVNNQYNIINPAGSLSTLTVNLPSSSVNNNTVYIKFTQAVTTVTYGNGTVVGGITSPVAGGLVILTYDTASTSWY